MDARFPAFRVLAAGLPALVFILAACNGGSVKDKVVDSSASDSRPVAQASRAGFPAGADAVPAPAATAAAAAAGGQSSSGGVAGIGDASAGGAADLDRKIIRNAQISLEVKDGNAVAQNIAAIASGMGGYVAASDLSNDGDNPRGTITVRVPADRFDDAMAQFRGLAVRVQHENVSSQDVTQEYADLDARVRNLEDTADQLRALLATIGAKSTNPNDVLTVYRELSDVTGQIEQAKGRSLYLDKLSSLATIVVELVPSVVAPPPPAQPQHAWSPQRTLEDAGTVLVRIGQLAVEGGIWIVVVLLPLIALAAIVALPVARIVRRGSARRAAAP